MLFYKDRKCRIDVSSRKVPEGEEIIVICSNLEKSILGWEKFIVSRPSEVLRGLKFILDHVEGATR